MQILLFANGQAQDGTMVQRVLDEVSSPHIVCADGGALNAVKFGFQPQVIIGDLDSLTAEHIADFETKDTIIQRYPDEKDETDLELALHWCIDHQATEIYIIGGLGGRFDQTLANIYLLTLPELDDTHIEMVDAEQSIRVLDAGTHQIDGQVGDTISLIPIGDAVRGIVTSDLKYPLDDEALFLGPARGVSNVMEADSATVQFAEGNLLLVHTVGRA